MSIVMTVNMKNRSVGMSFNQTHDTSKSKVFYALKVSAQCKYSAKHKKYCRMAQSASEVKCNMLHKESSKSNALTRSTGFKVHCVL
jgi:hypothetical protein